MATGRGRQEDLKPLPTGKTQSPGRVVVTQSFAPAPMVVPAHTHTHTERERERERERENS
jgi:hypothetical protein